MSLASRYKGGKPVQSAYSGDSSGSEVSMPPAYSSPTRDSAATGRIGSWRMRRMREGGPWMRPISVPGEIGTAQDGIGSPALRMRCSTPSSRLPPADSPAMAMRSGA